MPYSAKATTSGELIEKYKNALTTGKKVNVLIVPGHDDEYWGTQFGDIREADIVVAIGQYLYDYLKNDPRLNVHITRTQMGYTDIFKNYFLTNRTAINQFSSTKISTYKKKLATGQVQSIESVPHNFAQPEVALRLYGINKWVNENDVDIVLHLHVNDLGGRAYNTKGKHTGISLYIPEQQFAHAGVSRGVGQAIFNELMLKNSKSTYPPEAAGLLEEQDLIAIGASNTLNRAAAALIEYGYIYEPQWQNLAIQETVTKNFAYQTFLGLHRFFGDKEKVVVPAKTTFTKNLQKGSVGAEVSSLQTLLTKEGIYTCGIIGIYGPCTEKGVKAFQKKYGIVQTGTVGPLTRGALNLRY